MRLVCATWNVNAQPPGFDSLQSIFCRDEEVPPDVVAVALQELVDLKDVTNYLQTNQSEEAIARWTRAILDCLRTFYRRSGRRTSGGEGTSLPPLFSPLKAHCLVGTGLIVIVRTELLRNIRELKWTELSFGTLGVLGNKGAVGVRFRYIVPRSPNGPENEEEEENEEEDSVTMCFVGCHLAAHQNQVEKRNQDLSLISAKLRFKLTPRERKERVAERKKRASVSGLEPIGTTETAAPRMTKREASFEAFEQNATFVTPTFASEIGIMNHDVVFFMGDLNYRLDFPNKREVVSRLRRGEIRELLSRDQLSIERENLTIPLLDSRFVEPPISFPPTYKYIPGTIMFEGGEEDEARDDMVEEEIGALVVGKPLGGYKKRYSSNTTSNNSMTNTTNATGDYLASSSSSSSKRPPRIPSYCDRVFYHARDEKDWPIIVKRYYSCSTILASDHKPVGCEIDLPTIRAVTTRNVAPPRASPTTAPQISGVMPPPSATFVRAIREVGKTTTTNARLDEIELRIGDVIEVVNDDDLEEPGNEMLLGFSGDRIGYFPKSAVEEIGRFPSKATMAVLETCNELSDLRRRRRLREKYGKEALTSTRAKTGGEEKSHAVPARTSSAAKPKSATVAKARIDFTPLTPRSFAATSNLEQQQNQPSNNPFDDYERLSFKKGEIVQVLTRDASFDSPKGEGKIKKKKSKLVRLKSRMSGKYSSSSLSKPPEQQHGLKGGGGVGEDEAEKKNDDEVEEEEEEDDNNTSDSDEEEEEDVWVVRSPASGRQGLVPKSHFLFEDVPDDVGSFAPLLSTAAEANVPSGSPSSSSNPFDIYPTPSPTVPAVVTAAEPVESAPVKGDARALPEEGCGEECTDEGIVKLRASGSILSRLNRHRRKFSKDRIVVVEGGGVDQVADAEEAER